MEFVSAWGLAPALEIGRTRHEARTPIGCIEGNVVGTMLGIVVGNDVGNFEGPSVVSKIEGESLGAADGPINALTSGVSLEGRVGNDASNELGILLGTADGVAAPLPTYKHNERITKTALITAAERFFKSVKLQITGPKQLYLSVGGAKPVVVGGFWSQAGKGQAGKCQTGKRQAGKRQAGKRKSRQMPSTQSKA